MLRFKQYIFESTSHDLSQAHAVFAMTSKRVTAARQQQSKDALAKLQQALADGQIYNADFNELKQTLAYNLERVEDDLKDSEFYPQLHALGDNNNEARRAFLDKFGDYGHGMQGSKKNLKNWGQAPEKFPGLLRVAQAGLEIKAALEALKPLIIKGRAPKPVDPNKFVKPAADYNHQKTVAALLNDSAKDVRGELKAAMVKREQNGVAALTHGNPTKYGAIVKTLRAQPQLQLLFQAIYKYNSIHTKAPIALRNPDEIHKIVENNARRQTEDILQHFVAKNTEKLALIFQKKKMTSHKILANRVNNGVLENKMELGFEDGSGFKIWSQVEYAQSNRGVYFMRMPTRFTDVKLADGSMMKMPSEEKMIKEF